ncbi:MAG: cation transporter [Acidimicrobiales bacterium]
MSAPATATATFLVTGMHCASCGMLIDDVVEDLVGVVSSATSARGGRTVVTYDPARCTVADIAAAITASGDYAAELDDRPSRSSRSR